MQSKCTLKNFSSWVPDIINLFSKHTGEGSQPIFTHRESEHIDFNNCLRHRGVSSRNWAEQLLEITAHIHGNIWAEPCHHNNCYRQVTHAWGLWHLGIISSQNCPSLCSRRSTSQASRSSKGWTEVPAIIEGRSISNLFTASALKGSNS